jgi:hypothetical protein
MSHLFLVSVMYRGVVMADSAAEAEDFADEIVRWDGPEVEVGPFASGEVFWPDDALVYHSGESDITLEQAKQRAA